MQLMYKTFKKNESSVKDFGVDSSRSVPVKIVAGFQLCFSSRTWYGGFVGMMIFGASEVSRNVDLGDETTTMMCKFVLRASDASILNEISADLQECLDNFTDEGVEYMSEEEVKARQN